MEFAKPGDPLVDGRGDVLEEDDDVADGGVVRLPSTVLAQPKAHEYASSERRVLTELPAESAHMHAISVVLVYSILGISDSEISEVTRLGRLDLKELKESLAYQETFDAVIGELISAQSQFVRSRVAAYSGLALNGIVEAMTSGRKEELRFAASKDILDRSDKYADMSMDRQDEFRIVVVQKSDESKAEVDISIKAGSRRR